MNREPMPRPAQNFETPPYLSGNFPQGFATTVEHFLSLSSYRYIWQIPKHQRPYSWRVTEKEDDPGQVEEFFSDIQDAAIGGYVHSLGTIDTTEGEGVNLKWKHAGPNECKDYARYVVNDGQQRLTTIFLAYAAICEIKDRRVMKSYRKEFSADPNIEVASSSFRLVHQKNPSKHQYRLHLQIDTLNQTLWGLISKGDDFAFTTYPSGIVLTADEVKEKTRGKSRPANRLIDAYVCLRKKLGDLSITELDNWEGAFYKSELSYIVSKTPPYLMFETRNARGLSVSGLDIVKNWMLYAEEYWFKNKDPIGSQPESKWWNALNHMDSGKVYDEKALLGHVRTIVHGSSIGGSSKDSGAFKRKYPISKLSSKKGSRREEFVKFVEAMEWVAKAMKEVYEPNKDGIPNGKFDEHIDKRSMNGKQAAEALVNLINISCRMDRTGVANTIILLTYHFLQPKEWVEVLKFLEKMIFRVHLVGREDLGNLSTGGQELGTYCNTFYVAVQDKDPTDAKDYIEIKKALKVLIDSLCDWTRSKQNLSQLYEKIVQKANRYNGGAWTRYLLYHWEMAGPQSKNDEIHLLRLYSGALDWGNPEKTHDLFQIEHVAADEGWKIPVPKNPRVKGFTAGEPYWEPQFGNEDTYDKWKNYLGNLVLSIGDPNRIYSNLPYTIAKADGEDEENSEKRWKYLNYPGMFDWSQVRALGRTYRIWNKQTIEDRQERIARWAVQYWKLPCDNDVPPALDKLEFIDEHTDDFKNGGSKLGEINKSAKGPSGGHSEVKKQKIPSIERPNIDARYEADKIDYDEHKEYVKKGHSGKKQ